MFTFHEVAVLALFESHLSFLSRRYNLSLSLEITQGASPFKEGICACWQLPELCSVGLLRSLEWLMGFVSFLSAPRQLDFISFYLHLIISCLSLAVKLWIIKHYQMLLPIFQLHLLWNRPIGNMLVPEKSWASCPCISGWEILYFFWGQNMPFQI